MFNEFVSAATALMILVTPVSSTEKPVTRDMIIIAGEMQVRALLRDADSAKFNIVAVKGYAVCGLVNARNGFGGYTGPVRFIAYPKAAVIDEGDSIFKALFAGWWAEVCADA